MCVVKFPLYYSYPNIYRRKKKKKEIAILVFSYHAALIWTTLGQILNFKPRVSYIDSIRPLLLWLSGSEEAPLLRPKC